MSKNPDTWEIGGMPGPDITEVRVKEVLGLDKSPELSCTFELQVFWDKSWRTVKTFNDNATAQERKSDIESRMDRKDTFLGPDEQRKIIIQKIQNIEQFEHNEVPNVNFGEIVQKVQEAEHHKLVKILKLIWQEAKSLIPSILKILQMTLPS